MMVGMISVSVQCLFVKLCCHFGIKGSFSVDQCQKRQIKSTVTQCCNVIKTQKIPKGDEYGRGIFHA